MPLFTTPGRHRGINTGLHYSLLGGRITVGEPDANRTSGSLWPVLGMQAQCSRLLCRAGLEERAGQRDSDTGPHGCA